MNRGGENEGIWTVGKASLFNLPSPRALSCATVGRGTKNKRQPALVEFISRYSLLKINKPPKIGSRKQVCIAPIMLTISSKICLKQLEEKNVII